MKKAGEGGGSLVSLDETEDLEITDEMARDAAVVVAEACDRAGATDLLAETLREVGLERVNGQWVFNDRL